MKRLFARLFPPRGRHRGVSIRIRMDNTDACRTWTEPVKPWFADGQPTPAPSTTDGAPATIGHVGATEAWSPLAEIGPDDEGTSFDADQRAWDKLLADLEADFDAMLGEFERGGSVAHAEFVRHRVAGEQEWDRAAPGWREVKCDRAGCELCPRDFDEAMAAAGVIALPAVVVDYGTAEWPVVLI